MGKKKRTSSRQGPDAASFKKSKTDKTPVKRKGSKETKFTTPTKTEKTSVVASTQKKDLEQYSKEAKESKEQFKPGNEERKGREAKLMIAEKTKRIPLDVTNSMWPFVSEVTLSEDGDTVHLVRNEVNHNTISPSLSNEITNNFLGNPIGANRGDKLHDPTMGTDMKCILTYNEKGINNKGPGKNVEQLRYCSSSLTKVGYGTLRPPIDESYSPDWGDEVLKKEKDKNLSFEKYCVLNSCTDEGLESIAVYNNISDEWEEKKKTFNGEVSMAFKRFEMLKLYAKHRNKRKYHLDPMEGGHRKAGIFQANFCAQLNPEDGSISDCLTFTPDHFLIAGLKPGKDITANHITGAYAAAIDEGTNDKGFFLETTRVDVSYLSDRDVSVPTFLQACRVCSESIAREKRNSATKDVFVECAKCVEEFIGTMSKEALLGNPSLKKFEYGGENKFPKKISAQKDVPKGNFDWKTDRDKICRKLENLPILSSDLFERYAKDPFNKENYSDFLKELEVPRMKKNNKEDDKVLIKPPFVVTYKSMAVHAGLGEKQRATTEMLNKWCLLPRFIHLLLANKKNISLVDAAKDDKVGMTVIYAMRHHVTSHGTLNLSYDACAPWYGLNKGYNMAEGENNVIIAALYLTEIVNAALTTITNNDGVHIGKKKLFNSRTKQLAKQTSDVTMLFSTMNVYANNPGIDTMINQLAWLYMADAELAHDLKNLTKVKLDKVHPGQLVYVHWINCVNESRSMIKQYGLLPEIKSTEDLKMMFPPMYHIYNYLECGVEKDVCLSVAEHFYSKVTSTSKRTLPKQSFYKEKSSLLIHLKLMHAYALRTLKGANPKVAFLRAGIYIGCKAKPKFFRDSLRYRVGDGSENERTLDKFNLFRLATNDVYLTPTATAAHLFETKCAENDKSRESREKYQEIVDMWKSANKGRAYVTMSVRQDKPAKKARTGNGGDDADCGDDEETKALTKTKFRQPMSELGKALDKCYKEHAKNNQHDMLADVLTKYNAIQKMVGFGKLFTGTAIEHQEYDDDAVSEDENSGEGEERNDNIDHADSDSGSEEDSASGSDAENAGEEENASDDSEEDDLSDSDRDEGGSDGNADGTPAGDDNNIGTENKDARNATQTSEPVHDSNSHGESAKDKDDNDVDKAEKEDALTALNKYIDGLKEGEVKRTVMTAEDIELALNLTTRPNLKCKDDRACFCSLKSDDMKLIKELYGGDASEEVQEEIVKKTWISPLVELMRALKWDSSINGLPASSTFKEEKDMLLWNGGVVSEKFMSPME